MFEFPSQNLSRMFSVKKHQNFSFRRVKEEEVEIKNDELADNTFEAKGVSYGNFRLFD